MNWKKHLRADEQLIWLGRPDARIQPHGGLGLKPRTQFLVTAVVLGVSGFFMLAVAPIIAGHAVLIAVAAGFVFLLLWWLWFLFWGKPRVEAYWRARTWYALTNRRALMAVHALGRDWLRAHKIRPQDRVTWDGRSPGNVIYSRITVDDGQMSRQLSKGFYLIEEGSRVKRMIEMVQKNLAAEAR